LLPGTNSVSATIFDTSALGRQAAGTGAEQPDSAAGWGVQKDSTMVMRETEIYDYARQLFEARGEKAVVEAAQKASDLEGQDAEAKTWRQIETTLKAMRGPRAS
jgi:hypothetical protein